MAKHRRLPANLLKDPVSDKGPVSAGRGGAWRTGLHADTQHDVTELRVQRAKSIKEGHAVLLLKPSQITDRVGTDRRSDWQDHEPYNDLRDSIEKHGQDTPIEVCPLAADWQPSVDDPTNVEGVQFEIITGRRRCAVAEDIGIDVRAIILPRDHEATLHHWKVLLRRYRENNHRSNLSPLERMLSVGEMYEAWAKTEQQPSLRKFAGTIGIDPTFVSRSNRLCQNEQQLRADCSDPYKLGYRELEAWLAKTTADHQKPKRASMPPSRGTKIEIGGHQVEWKRQKNKLVLIIPHVDEDPSSESLQRLLGHLVQELTASSSGSSS